MATNPLSRACTPSEADAVGLHNIVRQQNICLADFPGAITAIGHNWYYFNAAGRITGAQMFRKTAGDANTTTVDIVGVVNGAAESTILAAAMSVADADGNNLRNVGVIKTDHAAYQDGGIVVRPGDYVRANVTVAEGGSTAGLRVDITFVVGA